MSFVTDGVAEPHLPIKGAASPHGYAPSDAEALENARVIFRVDEDFEATLSGPMRTLGREARVVPSSRAPGMVQRSLRLNAAFERRDHDGHAEAGKDRGRDERRQHAAYDLHIWVDPANARATAGVIVETMSAADPANAVVYAKNGRDLASRLDALIEEVREMLSPVRGKPFIVFHDAYFEERFGLTAVEAVALAPERLPGALRPSRPRYRQGFRRSHRRQHRTRSRYGRARRIR